MRQDVVEAVGAGRGMKFLDSVGVGVNVGTGMGMVICRYIGSVARAWRLMRGCVLHAHLCMCPQRTSFLACTASNYQASLPSAIHLPCCPKLLLPQMVSPEAPL